MIVDAAQLSVYHRDGFLILRSFLNSDEIDELRREVNRYIREIVPNLPPSDAFYQDRSRQETLKQLHNMGQDAFFASYPRRAQWRELAESLVGEPVSAESPEWFNKPPRTEHITPPHQDNYYFCLTPPHVLTVWIPLEKVDEENGSLRYLPGSHQEGFRPHGRTETIGFSQGITDYCNADRKREVMVTLNPGDVVVHHGMTVHSASANCSATRHRPAFAMVFKGVSCRRDEAAFARYSQAVREQHANAGIAV